MTIYELGDRVRFKVTRDTVADGVDGILGTVVGIRDERPVVLVWNDEVLAHDDELELEE